MSLNTFLGPLLPDSMLMPGATVPYGNSFAVIGGIASHQVGHITTVRYFDTVYTYDTAANNFKLVEGSRLSRGLHRPAVVPIRKIHLPPC